MINPKLLQTDFDTTVKKLSSRGVEPQLIERLQETLHLSKELQKEIEALRAKQNALSKDFGKYKANNDTASIDNLKKELEHNKKSIATLQEQYNQHQEQLQNILHALPNIPDDKTPDGKNEEDNIELKKVLTPKTFDFEPKPHWDLAELNGWIDFARGVKIAKTRFSALKQVGASINRALMNYMIDFNKQYGFEEVRLPFISNDQSLFGTGQLPKFEEDLFKIEGESLYLIPTSEVTMVNFFQDEIIPVDELPIRTTSYSPCFRKEAGSAGRDTRGIMRQHQFEKVELVSLCHPDKSPEEFELMVECASKLLASLELPHRLMQLCTGDMGFGASETIDLEVWLPSENKYREISSVSNTKDFQARRAKIRYKDEEDKNHLLHTLNGSSLAIGRTIIAIMENHQNEDGTITIPEVLTPYMSR